MRLDEFKVCNINAANDFDIRLTFYRKGFFLKELRHGDLADFWPKLSWKLVVASLIHSEHFLWTSKRENKLNHGHWYRVFEEARKWIEKSSLNFSSCNPFPSSPFVAKDTFQQIQRINVAIVNKNRFIIGIFLCDTNINFSFLKKCLIKIRDGAPLKKRVFSTREANGRTTLPDHPRP